MKRFKDFNENDVEDELWNIATNIQKILEFKLKRGQIYVTLDGKEFSTGLYPKKLVRHYLKDIDLKKYFIEDGYYTEQSYLQEMEEIYKYVFTELTEDETGITLLACTLESNSNKVFNLKNAKKIIKKQIKELLEEQIYFEVDCRMDYDRQLRRI